jgi:5-methylcytosine-specific restriction endonuclease McrA
MDRYCRRCKAITAISARYAAMSKELCESCYALRIQIQKNSSNSRARQSGRDALLLLADWRSKLESYQGCCHYCGRFCGVDVIYIEHAMSIREGGHSTIANVFPSCAGCNSRKVPKEYRRKFTKNPRPI